MESFTGYKEMANSGESPLGIYIAAFKDGHKQDACVRFLVKIFNISKEEAYKIAIEGDKYVFEKYMKLKDLGATLEEISSIASKEGIDFASRIRILRMLSDLSFSDAKEVIIKAEGKYENLSAYQDKLKEYVEIILNNKDK